MIRARWASRGASPCARRTRSPRPGPAARAIPLGEVVRLRECRSRARAREGLDVVGRAAQLDRRARAAPSTRRPRLVRHADAAGVDEPRRRRCRGRTGRGCGRGRPCAARRRRSIGAMRASRESGVTISSSLRGDAWQKSTSPRPSTRPTRAAAGRPSSRAAPIELARPPSACATTRCRRGRCARCRRRAAGAPRRARARRCRGSRCARSPSARTASTASHGNGPPAMSPPTTIRSTPSRLDLGQHGRERGVVAVDVVERRDPHESVSLLAPERHDAYR